MVSRRLLDSSVLVAALFPAHPRHAWASAQLDLAEAGEPCVSTHSLAEVFKVLTVHPSIRLPPETALTVLEALLNRHTKVSLDGSDYHAALRRCAEHGLPGSVVFDALVAQAALKAGAGALVTLNPKDFQRLGQGVRERVVSP